MIKAFRVQKKGLKPPGTVFQRLLAFFPMVSPIGLRNAFTYILWKIGRHTNPK